jgi:hypothetical protein
LAGYTVATESPYLLFILTAISALLCACVDAVAALAASQVKHLRLRVLTVVLAGMLVALAVNWLLGLGCNCFESPENCVALIGGTLGPALALVIFQVRMSFAGLMTRRGYLRGHLVLADRREKPCFHKIDTISPRNHVHAFELREAQELQGDLLNCIGEAYRVGCQEHLRS